MRILFTLFLTSFAIICFGQTTRDCEMVSIKTKDNENYTGKLIKITSDSIIIKNNELGFIRLSKTNISLLSGGVDRLNSFKNLSEPIFFPTAYTNGKGIHYYRNQNIAGQYFSYGLTDNFEASFGFEFASILLIKGSIWPFAIAGLKYGIETSEKFHVGLSSKVLFNNKGGVIFTSVPFTFGSPRTNLTAAPTYVFDIGSDAEEFTILFNFNIGLSKRIRLSADILYIQDHLLGTSVLEIPLKNGIILKPGILYSSEFSFLPSFAFTKPFIRLKNCTKSFKSIKRRRF